MTFFRYQKEGKKNKLWFFFFDLDCIHNIVLVVTLDLSNKYLPTRTRYSFGHFSWNLLNLHSRNQKSHHCWLISDKKSKCIFISKNSFVTLWPGHFLLDINRGKYLLSDQGEANICFFNEWHLFHNVIILIGKGCTK